MIKRSGKISCWESSSSARCAWNALNRDLAPHTKMVINDTEWLAAFSTATRVPRTFGLLMKTRGSRDKSWAASKIRDSEILFLEKLLLEKLDILYVLTHEHGICMIFTCICNLHEHKCFHMYAKLKLYVRKICTKTNLIKFTCICWSKPLVPLIPCPWYPRPPLSA